MGKMFNTKGKLNLPVYGEVSLPTDKVSVKGKKVVVDGAYCPNGHDLMSDTLVDGAPGIHFIYTNRDGSKETDIVISPVVRKSRKKVLKGTPFKKGEAVRILCPHCRTELPVLFNCECGAPIYLFFIDRRLDHQFGQSFCSRIGCVRASQLRFSEDVMREFMRNHLL